LDVTSDRGLNLSDVYALHAEPADANADGLADDRDRIVVLSLVRAGELKRLLR
jgi:hypothetical protein